MTLDEALQELHRRLAGAPCHIDLPYQEALWILETGLRRAAASLLAHPEESLDPDEWDEIEALATRRASGEPLQYVLGVCEFYSRRFRIDRRAMIPRPATERLAESVIERCLEMAHPRILEVGTGSGALAITLALEIPGAAIVATDISSEALELAKANAGEHGLQTTEHRLQTTDHRQKTKDKRPRDQGQETRDYRPQSKIQNPKSKIVSSLTFVCADLLAPIADGACDVVVSNPPYVPRDDLEKLGPEIAHEPILALDGGPDGLAVLRALAEDWARVVRPGGFFACEVGIGQAAGALPLFERFPVEVIRDYAGIDRVMVFHR